MPSIDLVLITYNRLEYTRLALASILADPEEAFSLTIWDNASSDGTREFLRDEVSDPRIADIVLSETNIGQTRAVNQVWSRSKADLLGKMDNDCLVTAGWTRVLARAHRDIPRLGVAACWHFFPEDFNYEQARFKIQSFNGHWIFRHPWTCGTGLLIKRETYRKLGPIRQDATTRYWLKMALRGYINGFYYPLICQEHMDDPRSRHNRSRTMSFEQAYEPTYGWQKGIVRDRKEYDRLHREILRNLLTDPYDAGYYRGCRVRLRRLRSAIRRTGFLPGTP